MANDAIHAAIRKTFGLRESPDNLPSGSGRRYGRDLLARLFTEVGFTTGAEIGVRRGRFSEVLCLANPALHLFCVDPWSPYTNKYNKARQDLIYAEALKRLTPYRVTVIRKTSLDALTDFADASLDFVCIDGNHHYDHVCPDIIFWSKKVKSGGVVAVHDYYAFGWAGVVQAVNGYTFCHDIRPWYVTKELEPTAYWVNP